MNNIIIITLAVMILSLFPVTTTAHITPQHGVASFYHNKFQGRRTANGEVFSQWKYTAAHKQLPFNTIVQVTNLKNNRQITVRINDRGPFVRGRIIDLTTQAARDLGMIRDGVVPVKIRVLKIP